MGFSYKGLQLPYSEDIYATPVDQRRYPPDRYLPLGRWYFVYRIIRQITKSRKQSRKGRYDNRAWVEASVDIMRIAEGCGAKITIEGLEHVRNLDNPVVFVGNHMSTLETMVLPWLIAPHLAVTFVVKAGLTRSWLFGPIMRSRDPIVVSRANSMQDFKRVMDEGSEKIKNGISVIVFPQGRRKMIFDEKEFNTMGVKLAARAGVKVVPIAIKTDFWGNGKYLKSFGPIRRSEPVHIRFGEPIEVAGNGREAHRRVIEFIKSNLKEWNSPVVDP